MFVFIVLPFFLLIFFLSLFCKSLLPSFFFSLFFPPVSWFRRLIFSFLPLFFLALFLNSTSYFFFLPFSFILSVYFQSPPQSSFTNSFCYCCFTLSFLRYDTVNNISWFKCEILPTKVSILFYSTSPLFLFPNHFNSRSFWVSRNTNSPHLGTKQVWLLILNWLSCNIYRMTFATSPDQVPGVQNSRFFHLKEVCPIWSDDNEERSLSCE